MVLKRLAGKLAGFADRVIGGNVLRAAVNAVIGDYGQVLELTVEREKKTIQTRFQLKGESEAVAVTVGQYTVLDLADGEKILLLSNLSCDREWMQALLTNFIEGKEFPLPEKYRDIAAGYLS